MAFAVKGRVVPVTLRLHVCIIYGGLGPKKGIIYIVRAPGFGACVCLIQGPKRPRTQIIGF